MSRPFLAVIPKELWKYLEISLNLLFCYIKRSLAKKSWKNSIVFEISRIKNLAHSSLKLCGNLNSRHGLRNAPTVESFSGLVFATDRDGEIWITGYL